MSEQLLSLVFGEAWEPIAPGAVLRGGVWEEVGGISEDMSWLACAIFALHAKDIGLCSESGEWLLKF